MSKKIVIGASVLLLIAIILFQYHIYKNDKQIFGNSLMDITIYMYDDLIQTKYLVENDSLNPSQWQERLTQYKINFKICQRIGCYDAAKYYRELVIILESMKDKSQEEVERLLSNKLKSAFSEMSLIYPSNSQSCLNNLLKYPMGL